MLVVKETIGLDFSVDPISYKLKRSSVFLYILLGLLMCLVLL